MYKKNAAYVFTGLSTVTCLFHFALIIGMPWADISWGGQYQGKLPAEMRAASVASIIVLGFFSIIVLIRAGLILQQWCSLSKKLIWLVVAYNVIAIIAHLFTPSYWERVVWLPVVVCLFVSSFLVARSRVN